MKDTINEDVDGSKYGNLTTMMGIESTKLLKYIDDKGKLTHEFKLELQEFKEEELEKLE